MQKNMIIAPCEGEYGLALARAARDSGFSVCRARRQGLEANPTPESSDSGDPSFAWNPSSYVSAGALALGAFASNDVDVLVLLSMPDAGRPSLFDGPPGALGRAVEAAAMGPVWLSRELIKRFESRGGGKLLAISVEPQSSEVLAPGANSFGMYASASFRGLVDAVFDRARGASWKAWGIVEKSGKADALADFALGLLGEGRESKSGRWLSFTGRPGLFGVF